MLVCSLGYAGMLSGVCWHALWGMLYGGWGMVWGAYAHGVGSIPRGVSLCSYARWGMLYGGWGMVWGAYAHGVGAYVHGVGSICAWGGEHMCMFACFYESRTSKSAHYRYLYRVLSGSIVMIPLTPD
jgi:hypothetical protein